MAYSWRRSIQLRAVLATLLCTCAFVGPPRDRQPLLWDRVEPKSSPKSDAKPSDDKLSKRVRAVAIGSAGGILLSLVVQSVMPRREVRYRPQVVPQVIQVQSDFSWGSLGTGLLVGLGTGVILGSSMEEKKGHHGSEDPKVRSQRRLK